MPVRLRWTAAVLLLACAIVSTDADASAARAPASSSGAAEPSSFAPSVSPANPKSPVTSPARGVTSRGAFDALLLPAASAGDLASGAADHIVRAAFLGDDAPGALLVRGVPGYAAARKAALAGLARCARLEGAPMRRAAEWDENHGGGVFTRATVAAGAIGRLPPDLDAACGPELRPRLEALRNAADAAASAALPRLDELLGYDTARFFAKAASSEGSLDHFHVYQPKNVSQHLSSSSPSSSSSSSSPSSPSSSPIAGDSDGLETNEGMEEGEGEGLAVADSGDSVGPGLRGKGEHTDVGVAIVMTPALLVNHDGGRSEDEEEEERDAFGSRGLTLGGRSPELPPDALVVGGLSVSLE